MTSVHAHEASRHSGAPVTLFRILGSGSPAIGPYGFSDGETSITRSGQVYQPWPITVSDFSDDGSLDKSDITVSMALGTEIDALFLQYPPSQTVNLTIFRGHVGLAATQFLATWVGRITSASRSGNEIELHCQPISSVLARPGLRRQFQIGCPHVLFGPQCQASKAAATVTRLAANTSAGSVTLTSSLGDIAQRYAGGLLEWTHSVTGKKEIRTIVSVSGNGLTLQVRGNLPGIANGTTSLSVVRSCNRQMSGCIQHSNILNYGGQPFIPRENPLSDTNQFY